MALGGTSGGGGASQSAIKAGEAFYEISADDKKLKDALQRNVNRIRKLGATLKAVGASSTALGAAIALPIGKAAKTFADFDDQMRVVKAVTQSSNEEFERLNTLARDLGKSTSYSSTEVAALMTELGKMGFNAQEIEDTTAAVLNLARASGTEAALSAEILGSTLRQFNLETKESVRLTDLLAATANKSAVSVMDLGESLKYAGPVAADLGMSVDDTLALLGVLGNLGIKGTEAGTSIRRLGVVVAASGDAIKKEFGVATVDAAGNARPLVEVLDEIFQATKNMGTGERAQKFSGIFGLLGITGASALSKNTKSIREFRQELNSTNGVAAKTAQEMDAGLGGGIRKTKAAFDSLIITIGDAASPVLMEFGGRIIEVLNAGEKIIKNNKELIGILTTVAITLVAVGVPLAAMGFTISGVVTGVIALKTAIVGLIAVALSPLVIKLALVTAALAGITYALLEISGTANEVGPMLGRIGEIFSESFKGVIGALKKGDLALVRDILLVGFGSIMAELELLVTKSWVGLKGIFVDTFSDIIYVIKGMWNDFTSFIIDTLVDAVTTSVKVLDNIIQRINNNLPSDLQLPGFNVDEVQKAADLIKSANETVRQREENRLAKERRDLQEQRDKARQEQIEGAEKQAKSFREVLAELVRRAMEEPPKEVKVVGGGGDWTEGMESTMKKNSAEMAKAAKGAFQSADFRGTFAINESNKELKEQGKTLKKIQTGIDDVNKNLEEGLIPDEFT